MIKEKRKNLWRTISLTLILCLVITTMPAMAFATEPDETIVQEDISSSDENTITYLDPEDVTEENALLDESGEDYTTFDLGGGKRYSVFFTENIRFRDNDGNLVDYDPTLIDLDKQLAAQSDIKAKNPEGYAYRNAEGDSYQYIPELLSEETPVLLEKNGYQITLTPTAKTYKDFFGKQVTVKKSKEEIEDAYENIAKKDVKASYKDKTALAYIEYVSLNMGIKENIVLTKRPAKNIMEFEINAPGLRAEVSEADGSIGFFDKKTGEVVNIINAPNMNDATGEAYSEDLAYSIKEKQDEVDVYILTLTINKEYLKDKNRKYPVVIDPTDVWTINSNVDNLWDVYVNSSYPSSNYYNSSRQNMPVGKNTSSIFRTYINFLSLRSVINGTVVESALLKVYENANSNSGKTVEVYKVTEAWDKTTLTWSNQPSTGSSRTSHMVTTGIDKQATNIGLKTFARNISTGASNHGVMLRNAEETSSTYAAFYGSRYTSSTYRPKLSVTYFGDGDSMMNTISKNKEYAASGDTVEVRWSNSAMNAITSVQYRLIDKATGKAVNPAGKYEVITTTTTENSQFLLNVPIPNGLLDGEYEIDVRGVYYNGSYTPSSEESIYVDNTAPSITSFAESGRDGKGATYAWKVTEKYFKESKLYLNGSLLYTGKTQNDSYYINANGFKQNGYNEITLEVYDQIGNMSSDTIKISFDIRPPVVGNVEIVDSISPIYRGWRKNDDPMIRISGISDAESESLTKDNISYYLGVPGQEPDSADYIQPNIITMTKLSDGTYTAAFYLNAPIPQQGMYTIYTKVTDEAGNATFTSIGYNYDNTAPAGNITVRNQTSFAENDQMEGTAYIGGIVELDSGSPIYSNVMELWQAADGEEQKICQVYDNASGSSSGSNSKAFDTTKYPNGNYTLKMILEDEAGNTKTITKAVTIANKIAKPQLSASTSKNGNVTIDWQMPDSVTAITGLQYKVEDQSESTWTAVSEGNSLSGSFTAQVPDAEGTYKVSVRAVDETGTPGLERTITVRVDKTVPQGEITGSSQGIIKGTAADSEFAGWKIFIKAKDAADDTYEMILEGSDQKENELFGNIDLYQDEYPANTWYTIKLEVSDIAGNTKVVTTDIYKHADYPASEIIEPDFRIERPEYQGYTVPQIVLPDTAEKMALTANFFRTFTLSSADWFIDNSKTAADQAEYSLKNSDGSAKYDTDRAYLVAAVARGVLGGAHYSNTLVKNADVKEVSFEAGSEAAVTFDPAVSFTLQGPTEGYTYYVKTSGNYVAVTPGETVEFLDLDSDALTASQMTVKVEAAEGSQTPDLLLALDELQEETFEISGIESYRPDLLSASDKINYKTYLKWGIPESLPDDISYEVYRSTEKDFDPQLIQPLTEVKAGYYVEPNADYETKFYYRVRAVKKDAEGNVVARSSFSDQAASTVIDANEFTKRLGYKEYWNYVDFDLPTGSGYIEKSEGNFVYEQTDETLANEQLEVELTRTYNSRASSKSAFGIGWNHNYDIELLTTDYSEKLEEGQQLVMKDSTGTMFFFTKEANGSGEYISSMGRYLKLKKLSGDESVINAQLPDRTAGTESGKITRTIEAAYVVETKDNLAYYFNQGGQLVYMDEPNGNFLIFDHDIQKGLVSAITTSKNLSIVFTYNTQPGTDPMTVKSVTLPDSSSVNYNYTDGMLTSAVKTGAAGEGSVTYAYAYDSSGKLSSMDDGAGNSYTLTCNNKGQVSQAQYPDGQIISLARSQTESGMPQTVTSVTKDGAVMSSETASFDASSGNCLETVDGDGLITTYAYRDEMLARTTQQVAYEALENGAIVEKLDTRTTVTEYDETQNVTSEEDGFDQWSEVVEYDYGYFGEYDEDSPSHEEIWCDDELIGDYDYDYDDYGNLIYEYDHISDVLTEYDYYTEDDLDANSDWYGEIASETESLNGVVQSVTTYAYSYDASGNKTETMTDVTGDVTTVTVTKYDVMGRELENSTTVNGTVKGQATYTYDSFGRVTRSILTEGAQTTTTVTSYNGNGAVTSESVTTAGNGQSKTETTSYVYDNMNRVTSQTSTVEGKSRPETTAYAYGTIQRNPVLGDTESVYALITTTISGSTATKSFTDPNGNVIREDADGVSTYYAYDKSGNRISQASVGKDEDVSSAVITASVYDQRGNQTHSLTDVSYDSETGTYSVDENTVMTSTEYDAQSRAVKLTDGKGTVTAMSYDEEGQMTSITQDAGGEAVTTTVAYTKPTAADNTSATTITMAGGAQSKTIVDVQGQTIQEATIGSGSDGTIDKDYLYSDTGNITRVTDIAGNYRTYEYDTLDRKTAANYFDQNGNQTLRTEYVYDIDGNVTEMKDYAYENGAKTLYRWTENRYDGLGNLTSEAEVDCEGTEPTEAQLAAKRITYTYDDEDRLTTVTYPSGFDSNVTSLTYEYGDYSRLTAIKAVTASGTQTLRAYTYGSKGEIISIKDDRSALGGTGYTLKAYNYDKLDRPVSLTVTDSEKEGTAEQYTYAYDVNNQIVTETKLNHYPAEGIGRVDETWNYVYDNLGRLMTTTVTDNGSGEVKTQKAYTYDKAGNRLTETEDGVTTTNTYNSLNQMVTSGSSSYIYDANGNQIKETNGSSVKEYTYDADNRLESATFTENGIQTLLQENAYNGEGLRIAKKETKGGSSEETRYTYQSGSVVYTDGSEGKKSLNIQGDSSNVIAAERDTDAGKGYYFYNKDMRVSTTSILDGSGNCEAAYEYTDFGETTASSDFYNEICYTGGIYDASTGLYYLNARYYDPSDGRFLTEDTYRGSANSPSSLHLYAYCANNPVNYVDPSGHKEEYIGCGVQIDAAVGKKGGTLGIGLDLIYLVKGVKARYKGKAAHIYWHHNGNFDIMGVDSFAKEICGQTGSLTSKNKLTKLANKVGFTLTVVFFGLFGDKKKTDYKRSVPGSAIGVNCVINHFVFSISTGKGGVSIGAGFSSAKFSLGMGVSNSYFHETLTKKYRNKISSFQSTVKANANTRYNQLTRNYNLNSGSAK